MISKLKKIKIENFEVLEFYKFYSDNLKKLSVILEGSNERYVYIARDPVTRIKALNNVLEVIEINSYSPFKSSREYGNILENLRKYLKYYTLESLEIMPFSLRSGFIGNISYDIVKYIENIELKNKSKATVPEIDLMLFNEIIIFDKKNNELFLLFTDYGYGGYDLEKRLR